MISNSDTADGFSESLIASVVGTSGSVSVSGTSTGDIVAGGTGTALAVSFPTGAVGTDGTVTLDLETDGTGIDGFGTTDLGDISLPVTIDNDATAAIEQLSGPGTITGSGGSYSLNLGSIRQGTGSLAARFGVVNSAMGPADLLSGSFTASGPGVFSVTGTNAFSGDAAGQSDSAPLIVLQSSSVGVFTETVTLSPTGYNASGYSGTLQPETLTVTGTVTPSRDLVWTGATDTNVGNASDWDDTTNGLDPALSAPGPTDIALFLAGGGTLTGSLSAADLQFGGAATWSLTAAEA